MRKFLIGLVMLFPLIGTAVAQSKVEQLAVAIARTEGFYANKRTIPARLHNPGDIRSHSRHAYVGQVGLYRGYVVFRSDRDGWVALREQIQRVIDGTSKQYTQEMTFAQVATRYAQDRRWGTTVCKILKITPATTVAEYFDLAPRILLTGAGDATKLRLFDGRGPAMPSLSWMSPMPSSLR
jgi:hypothetical protein